MAEKLINKCVQGCTLQGPACAHTHKHTPTHITQPTVLPLLKKGQKASKNILLVATQSVLFWPYFQDPVAHKFVLRRNRMNVEEHKHINRSKLNNKLTPWSRTNLQNPTTFSWSTNPLPVIESQGSYMPFQWLRWSSGRVLPLSTQVRGFKPSRSRQDFSGRKNPQHAFLWKGSKAVGPMLQICGM